MTLTLDDLLDRVRTLPKAQGREQALKYLIEFVGPQKRGDVLRNRFRKELVARIKKL